MFIVSLSVDNIKFYLSSYKDFLWLILGIIYLNYYICHTLITNN